MRKINENNLDKNFILKSSFICHAIVKFLSNDKNNKNNMIGKE